MSIKYRFQFIKDYLKFKKLDGKVDNFYPIYSDYKEQAGAATGHYFHQDLPSELDSLSTHTRPDEVSDIDIDEINISSKSIFIKGNGVVSVEMQFGSDSDQNNDDGFKINDNFPFDFALTLGYNDENKLEIVDVQKVEIDTSSYYENAI